MSRIRSRSALSAAFAALAAFLCILPGESRAVILGSPHDFSETGPFDTAATRANMAASGACSSCHIPHRAADPYAIWPRDLSGYRSNLANDGDPSTVPNYVLFPTIPCYDCHDYHGGGGINNLPNLSDFDTTHRPQNVAFGFTKNGTGSMTEDAPGGTVRGYYENRPPAGASTYGADPNLHPTDPPYPADNTNLLKTGGHYFKTKDPTVSSGDAFDIGDKLPCRDCHDPHVWASDWQAFIRPNLGGPTGWSRINPSGKPTASTYMANAPVSGTRSDVNSRTLCIACHGNSDTLDSVNFNDIGTSYTNSTRIVRPTATVREHANTSQAACVSCHEHNSIDANCSQCHGFPPNPYPPDRNAAPTFGAYSQRDPHPQHVGRGDGQPLNSVSIYSFDCTFCHATSALGSRSQPTIHQNDSYDIAYDLSSLDVANPPDTASAGRLTCGNVYCHSNGGADNTMGGGGGYFRSPQWGVTAAPLRCNGCHGPGTPDNAIRTGMPEYPSGAAGSATANSHTIHVVGNGYSCPACHAQTAQDPYASGRTIVGTPLRHVNGTREVAFDGTTATGSYNVDESVQANDKRCDVSCHGTGKPLDQRPQWGGTLVNGCFDCHVGTEQIYKPQNDYGTPKAPNPVDNNEYLHSGHGRAGSNYPGSNNAPAGFSNYQAAPVDCYICHSQGALHTTKSPNDPFRLGSAADGTTGGTGTWTGAWADNTDLLCLGCHGTAAQRSGHDNAAQGPTTVDAQTHAHGITGIRYTWPVSPWKCVDCHDPHGDGRAAGERYMMIRSGINAPATGTDANAGSDGKSRPKRTDANVLSVSFGSLAGFAAGSYAQPENGAGGTWGPCEVCHTQPVTYSRTKDNLASHATRTDRCTLCHPHEAGFAAVCKACHGPDSVATSTRAPDVGAYWTTSGHGRFQAGSPPRSMECEDCHDTLFLTLGEHKMDGTVPNSPPHNINTLAWPGKTPLNPDTNPNLNTAHLSAGYIDASATSREAIARAFDNQCANACHTPGYHRHQNNNNPPGVMRFGDHGTKANPKLFEWYVWDTSNPVNYPNSYYRSRSPWIDSDVRTATGMSDPTVSFGLCVSCHDPHGTGVTDTSGYPGLGTSNHMLRGNWLPPAGPVTFCNNAACHGP